MDFYIILTLFVVLYPLLVYMDCKVKMRSEADPSVDYNPNHQASNTAALFIPFSVLFYTELFWWNLLYYLPLYFYFWCVLVYANKKASLGEDTYMFLYQAFGSFLLVVLGYYLFFHEGILVESELLEQDTDMFSKQVGDAVWPYVIFVCLLLATIAVSLVERAKNQEVKLSLTLLITSIIVLPLLPLFISHYWWGLLAGSLSFLVLSQLVLRNMEQSSQGGIGFVCVYGYMMVSIASIALYALLF